MNDLTSAERLRMTKALSKLLLADIQGEGTYSFSPIQASPSYPIHMHFIELKL
jgi:hypothetical protein